MAISTTHLTNGTWGGVTGSSFSTASIAPTGGHLILCEVFSAHYANDGVHSPTVSGDGLTWVQVAQVVVSNGFYVLTLFRAMAASPSSGALTIDFAGVVQDECYWTVEDVGGAVTTGLNGADAIVQIASGSSGGQSSFSLTLTTFSSTNNGTMGFFAQNATSLLSPGAGFTKLTSLIPNFGSTLISEWRSDNSTTVDASSDTVQGWEGIAIEVQAIPPLTFEDDSLPPFFPQQLPDTTVVSVF